MIHFIVMFMIIPATPIPIHSLRSAPVSFLCEATTVFFFFKEHVFLIDQLANSWMFLDFEDSKWIGIVFFVEGYWMLEDVIDCIIEEDVLCISNCFNE